VDAADGQEDGAAPSLGHQETYCTRGGEIL
jgi:hypothetical protein